MDPTTMELLEVLAAGPDWLPPILLRMARSLPDAQTITRQWDGSQPDPLLGERFAAYMADTIDRASNPAWVVAVISVPSEQLRKGSARAAGR